MVRVQTSHSILGGRKAPVSVVVALSFFIGAGVAARCIFRVAMLPLLLVAVSLPPPGGCARPPAPLGRWSAARGGSSGAGLSPARIRRVRLKGWVAFLLGFLASDPWSAAARRINSTVLFEW